MPSPIDGIAWESLSEVAVLGTVLTIFMQLMGKGLIEALLCWIMRGLFKMTNDQVGAWPGRSPIYFSFMFMVGFGLLLWRGLEAGPALIMALIAVAIASGEYEGVKSLFRASGQKVVPAPGPLGYKWH